jgi:hypothetical protein
MSEITFYLHCLWAKSSCSGFPNEAILLFRNKDTSVNKLQVVIKLAGMDPSMPPLKDSKIGKKHGPAYQAAAEYGIDIHQLDFLLTLTPAERLMRHDAELAFVLAAREAGIRYFSK